jgi:hypothetical protein
MRLQTPENAYASKDSFGGWLSCRKLRQCRGLGTDVTAELGVEISNDQCRENLALRIARSIVVNIGRRCDVHFSCQAGACVIAEDAGAVQFRICYDLDWGGDPYVSGKERYVPLEDVNRRDTCRSHLAMTIIINVAMHMSLYADSVSCNP